MENHKGKIIIATFISFFAFIIIFNINSDDRYERYSKELLELKIEGKVIKTSYSRFDIKIKLRNNKKIIIPKADNYQYDPPELHNFLMKGDSIIKEIGNDTLYVLRGNEKFYFIIGKRNLNFNSNN